MSLELESSPFAIQNPLFAMDESRVHDLGTNRGSPPPTPQPLPERAAPGSPRDLAPAGALPSLGPSSDSDAAAAAMVALASAVAASSSDPPSLAALADEERANESGSEASSISGDGNSAVVIARSNSYGSTTVLEESPLSSLSVLSAPAAGVSPSSSPYAQRAAGTRLSPTPEAAEEEDEDDDDDSSAAASDPRSRGYRAAAPGSAASSGSASGSSSPLDAASSAASPYSLNRQVSCQGCSRVFIINVLRSACDCVKGKALPSIFTFKKKLVQGWLLAARDACSGPSYPAEEAYFGGPPFSAADPSTHWFEPHQFYTWWKNNIERKSKFRVLIHDSFYSGYDSRQLSRAHWCAAVVALSEIIRRSSGSHNNHLKGRKAKALSQERIAALEAIEGIPYTMPGVEPSNEDKEEIANEDAKSTPSSAVEPCLEKFHAKYLDFIGDMMRHSPHVAASIGAPPLLPGDKRGMGNEASIALPGSRRDSYPIAMPSAGGAQPAAYSSAEALLSAGGVQVPVGVAFPAYRSVDPMRTAALMNPASQMHYQPGPNATFSAPSYVGQISASPIMFNQSGAIGGLACVYPSRGPISSGQPYAYMQLMGNSRENIVLIPVYSGYHQDITPSGSPRPLQMPNHGQFFGSSPYPIIGIDSQHGHSAPPYGHSDRSSSLSASAPSGVSSRPINMMGANNHDLNWSQSSTPNGFQGTKDFLTRMAPGSAMPESSPPRSFGGYSSGSSNQAAAPRPKEEPGPHTATGDFAYPKASR